MCSLSLPPPSPAPAPPPQAQLLSSWFTSSAVCDSLTLTKLWLFNNALGDEAAPALAAIIAAR